MSDENTYKYCSQIPIRNSCNLWLTTSVAIALCTARDLSHVACI